MMTREYLRYALMTAALGFWLLCVSIGGVWGGLEVGVSCLCNLFAVSIWSPLAYLLVFGLPILFTSISFVASLGRRLAAEAPRGCSVSALLLPPLLPLLMLAFIPPATEKLRSLLQLHRLHGHILLRQSLGHILPGGGEPPLGPLPAQQI